VLNMAFITIQQVVTVLQMLTYLGKEQPPSSKNISPEKHIIK
jgi:hypothetical protein